MTVSAVGLYKDLFASPQPSTICWHLNVSEVFCRLPASFRGPRRVLPEPPDAHLGFGGFSLPMCSVAIQVSHRASRHAATSPAHGTCRCPPATPPARGHLWLQSPGTSRAGAGGSRCQPSPASAHRGLSPAPARPSRLGGTELVAAAAPGTPFRTPAWKHPRCRQAAWLPLNVVFREKTKAMTVKKNKSPASSIQPGL